VKPDQLMSSAVENVMTTPDDNPFRAPQSAFEPIESTFNTNLRRLRVCLGLQCATIALGVAAAFYNIHSIEVTGGILFLAGVVTAFLSRRLRLTDGLVFGLSGPAISLVCFAMINLLNWSPTDAQHPVSILAVGYATCALPLGLYVWIRTGSDNDAVALEEQLNGSLVTDEVQHEPTNMG